MHVHMLLTTYYLLLLTTYYVLLTTYYLLLTTYYLPGVLSKRSMAVPKGEHMDAGNMFAAPNTLE